MKHPMAAVAVLYATGILLGCAAAVPLPWLFGASLALSALAIVSARWRARALIPLWVMAGWTNLGWQTAPLSPLDLRKVLGDEPVLATVRGVLLETPWERALQTSRGEIVRTLGLVEAHAILRNGSWEPVRGRIVTRTYGSLGPQYFTGREVMAAGLLQPPPGPAAEGLFDYSTHLRWQGIHFQLLSDSTNDWSMASAAAIRPPFADRFRTWAQAALARGLPCEDETLRLLWAMTLGWKTGLDGSISESYMKTGTMHIFAISGLHIALIAGILVRCLAVLRVPRTWCGGVVVPVIWFYTLATGWQSSAIRSTVMMSVIILGWSLHRPSNLLNSLAAAGTILLLWEPCQLFQPSFQLSFFVVLGMALLMPRFEEVYAAAPPEQSPLAPGRAGLARRWFGRIKWLQWRPDPLIPRNRIPLLVRWRWSLFRMFAASFSTSLSAWLASLPLVVWYFNLFTPVSLLANLIVVPISTLALMSNLGGILCAWVEPVAVLFNHSAWFWMLLMQRICAWMADWPYAAIYLPKPTLPICILYYITVFGAFAGWFWKEGWHARRCGVLCLAWILVAGQVWYSLPLAKVTVLALRAGDSIFIDEPGKQRDLLIDGGDARSGEFMTRSFLHAQGVNRLPVLLLTHGDVQHCGAASNLIGAFHVEQIVASPVRFRSKPYRDLLSWSRQAGLEQVRVAAGGKAERWKILHPDGSSGLSLADDQALVLHGEIGGIRLLLCSDLGRLGQRKLLESGGDMQADILIGSAPAVRDGLASGLIQAVNPQAVILSAGAGPLKKAVQSDLHRSLQERGIVVCDTAEDGSAMIIMEQGVARLRMMSGVEARISARIGTSSKPRVR